MERILVTGANGFIGSHIVERLLADGYHVMGLVRKTSDLTFLIGINVELVYGDITDLNSIFHATHNINIIVHNAGLASDWGKYEDFERINVQGTKNIAEAALRNNVKRIVYMSSTAIHGFGSKTKMNENSPRNHKDFPYSKSKQVAEDWLFDFGKNNHLEVTAIRPGNVFGPRDHTFMSKYLEAMERGKAAEINHGVSKTCPTYVENLVRAVSLACMHKNADGEAFIITDGLDIDWHSFNKKLVASLGLKNKLNSFPYTLAYFAGYVLEKIFTLFKSKEAPLITTYRVQNGGLDYDFSIEKAKSILGFKPMVSPEDAISKTIDWYKRIRKR